MIGGLVYVTGQNVVYYFAPLLGGASPSFLHFLAKFTSVPEQTSCRPTSFENYMTIFRQCINVLDYKGKIAD